MKLQRLTNLNVINFMIMFGVVFFICIFFAKTHVASAAPLQDVGVHYNDQSVNASNIHTVTLTTPTGFLPGEQLDINYPDADVHTTGFDLSALTAADIVVDGFTNGADFTAFIANPTASIIWNVPVPALSSLEITLGSAANTITNPNLSAQQYQDADNSTVASSAYVATFGGTITDIGVAVLPVLQSSLVAVTAEVPDVEAQLVQKTIGSSSGSRRYFDDSAVVVLQGWTYPDAIITVYANEEVLVNTRPNQDGYFYLPIDSLSSGGHDILIYTKSDVFGIGPATSLTVDMPEDDSLVLYNVHLAPTVGIVNAVVPAGQVGAVVYGQAPASASMYIYVTDNAGQDYYFAADVDAAGRYTYDIPALSAGQYQVSVFAVKDGQWSLAGYPVTLSVFNDVVVLPEPFSDSSTLSDVVNPVVTFVDDLFDQAVDEVAPLFTELFDEQPLANRFFVASKVHPATQFEYLQTSDTAGFSQAATSQAVMMFSAFVSINILLLINVLLLRVRKRVMLY